jgi:glutaconate CoA-transferase, subunit B
MSEHIGDLITATLAQEIADSGIRVFAVTSPASVAAGLAARALGACDLALATGFTALDGSPVPAVTLGEAALFTDGTAAADEPFDTFALLRRGRAGVAVTPAQLDAHGQTNLSGVGAPGAPKVALPGARGLPDNNASPSRVWYVLPAHSPRQLVERVDVVCGAVPGPGTIRRLITPAGCFELHPDGWQALWLTEGGAELVAGAPGLGITLTEDTPVRTQPDPAALAALREADPGEIRLIEFSGGAEAGERFQAAAAREAAAIRS